jgi:hypothetical protein
LERGAPAAPVKRPLPTEEPGPESIALVGDRVLRSIWWTARRRQGRKLAVPVGVVLFGETMWDR